MTRLTDHPRSFDTATRAQSPVENPEPVPTLTSEIEVIRPTVAPAGDEPKPGRKFVFAIVGLALLMASIDATIVATALTAIQKDLGAGLEWSAWTITIYALGQILVMPLAGKLSDMYGRKKIFMVAIVLFGAASLACGLATNIYVLVALRFVQSIGGGAFMPSATGIVSDQFGRERDRAIGLFTSVFPIGAVLGPVLGGVLVTTGSWRSIFLVNVPVAIALIVLVAIFVPNSPLRPAAKLDVLGVVLLGGLLLAAMLGITSLGNGSSLLSVRFILPEAVAIVLVVLFLLRSKYATSPFVPLKFLRGNGFGAVNLLNFLFGSAGIGLVTLIPLYAHERFGIAYLGGGTLLSARAIGMIAVAGIATFALRRTGTRIPIAVGFTVVAIGIVGMAIVPSGVSPYAWLSLAGAVIGVGMGFAMPAANNAVMQLAPHALASISGLRGMFRQSGAIISVSIVTALVAQSSNAGETLAISFIVFAGIVLCAAPLILLVPEHRGRW